MLQYLVIGILAVIAYKFFFNKGKKDETKNDKEQSQPLKQKNVNTNNEGPIVEKVQVKKVEPKTEVHEGGISKPDTVNDVVIQTKLVEKKEPVEKHPIEPVKPVEKHEPIIQTKPVEKHEPVIQTKPVKPIVKHEIPVTKHDDPVIQTKPVEKHEKPIVKLEIPVSKHEDPVIQTKPVEKHEDPVIKTKPVEKHDPIVKQEEPEIMIISEPEGKEEHINMDDIVDYPHRQSVTVDNLLHVYKSKPKVSRRHTHTGNPSRDRPGTYESESSGPNRPQIVKLENMDEPIIKTENDAEPVVEEPKPEPEPPKKKLPPGAKGFGMGLMGELGSVLKKRKKDD